MLHLPRAAWSNFCTREILRWAHMKSLHPLLSIVGQITQAITPKLHFWLDDLDLWLMTLSIELVRDVIKVNSCTKFCNRTSIGSAVRVFTHGHKDTQTDSSVSITTADAGDNENPSAILNSPLCYHMLTANGRFFITVNRTVIRTHLIAQISPNYDTITSVELTFPTTVQGKKIMDILWSQFIMMVMDVIKYKGHPSYKSMSSRKYMHWRVWWFSLWQKRTNRGLCKGLLNEKFSDKIRWNLHPCKNIYFSMLISWISFSM